MVLAQYLAAHTIDLATLPPALLKMMEPGKLLSLKTLITAGEMATGELLSGYEGIYFNAYGPTETSICATVFQAGERKMEPGPVSIGKPIHNTQVYIVDENTALVPGGVPGEICISGAGLARGYLNRPELTAEKFVENPFHAGERMYRTGDMGRWMHDGIIEFMGRKDEQVKIRGYRIEPGEVENALQSVKDIEAAVVTAKTSAGEKELVAYLVSSATIEVQELRSSLLKSLPAYMIPTHFVQLEALPITTNGKIDRKRLPEPERTTLQAAVYVAPRNEAEQRMALAWQEALEREQVGIRDNFFDLGGYSLKAMKLQRLLNRKYGFRISIRDIYNHPTIEELVVAGPGSSRLVQLSAGKPQAPRIYMIPPILGNVILYKPLADRLQGLNCYGLQYSGLEGNEALYDSIEQAAQEFSTEIMKKEQNGDFVLLGYSMGALIAFEMTKILEEKFGPIQLVLIDRPPVNAETGETPDDATANRQLDWMLEQYKSLTGDAGVDAEGLKRFLVNNVEMMKKYESSGRIKSDIQVLECREKRTASMTEWEEYTGGAVEHRFIEGTHWEALSPENLPLVEKTIRSILGLEYNIEPEKHNLQY